MQHCWCPWSQGSPRIVLENACKFLSVLELQQGAQITNRLWAAVSIAVATAGDADAAPITPIAFDPSWN